MSSIRYLTLSEILFIHREVIKQAGGTTRIRDMDALKSSLSQIRQTVGGEELYPSLEEKAAALCFFVVKNHPFEDGNKRVGYNAMEVFLSLNGVEMESDPEESEEIIWELAAGNVKREELTEWLRKNTEEG